MRRGEGALHGIYPLSSFSPGCPPIACRKASKTWHTHHTSRVSYTALMCEYGVQQNRAHSSFLELPPHPERNKRLGGNQRTCLELSGPDEKQVRLCSASSTYPIFYGQHSLPFWPSKTIDEMLPALRDT